MPLAFFCTLFFRHRKKSVSAPWDGKSQSAPESARQAPPKGNFLGRGFSLRSKQGGFPLAPLHPLRIATRSNRAPHRAASPPLAPVCRRVRPRQRGISSAKLSLVMPAGSFPRGKQSARPALPCAPLVVCLNSGSSIEAIERPIGLQALPPRRSRRVRPHRGAGVCGCGRTGGFPRGKQSARIALPCAPLVVCLNSGSLTAFGGCIHWIPASLRSPLHPFGDSARPPTPFFLSRKESFPWFKSLPR